LKTASNDALKGRQHAHKSGIPCGRVSHAIIVITSDMWKQLSATKQQYLWFWLDQGAFVSIVRSSVSTVWILVFEFEFDPMSTEAIQNFTKYQRERKFRVDPKDVSGCAQLDKYILATVPWFREI